MRWLGVDLGSRRIGLSFSEDDEGPATLLRTVTIATGGEAAAVVAAAAETKADRLVIGLPLEMSGKEGLAARKVRAVAAAVQKALPLPIAFIDERLTSTEAHRALSASGKNAKAQKASVDQLAAKILLDTHLGMLAAKRGRSV